MTSGSGVALSLVLDALGGSEEEFETKLESARTGDQDGSCKARSRILVLRRVAVDYRTRGGHHASGETIRISSDQPGLLRHRHQPSRPHYGYHTEKETLGCSTSSELPYETLPKNHLLTILNVSVQFFLLLAVSIWTEYRTLNWMLLVGSTPGESRRQRTPALASH